MKRTTTAVAVLAAIAIASATGCPGGKPAPVAPTAEAPQDVVTAVKATIEQWRNAYEARSLDSLSKLYSRDLDLVVVQEGAPLLGWAAAEPWLKERLARYTTVIVRLKDVHVVSLAPDLASAVATMSREMGDGVTSVRETGAVTLTLRKVDATWLIVAEHYSYKRS